MINGEKIYNSNEMTQVNPARHSQKLAEVSQAGEKEIQQAIEAAKQAKAKWGATP